MDRSKFEKLYNFKSANLGIWIRERLTKVKHGDVLFRNFQYYSDRIDRIVFVEIKVFAQKKSP